MDDDVIVGSLSFVSFFIVSRLRLVFFKSLGLGIRGFLL